MFVEWIVMDIIKVYYRCYANSSAYIPWGALKFDRMCEGFPCIYVGAFMGITKLAFFGIHMELLGMDINVKIDDFANVGRFFYLRFLLRNQNWGIMCEFYGQALWDHSHIW